MLSPSCTCVRTSRSDDAASVILTPKNVATPSMMGLTSVCFVHDPPVRVTAPVDLAFIRVMFSSPMYILRCVSVIVKLFVCCRISYSDMLSLS